MSSFVILFNLAALALVAPSHVRGRAPGRLRRPKTASEVLPVLEAPAAGNPPTSRHARPRISGDLAPALHISWLASREALRAA